MDSQPHLQTYHTSASEPTTEIFTYQPKSREKSEVLYTHNDYDKYFYDGKKLADVQEKVDRI